MSVANKGRAYTLDELRAAAEILATDKNLMRYALKYMLKALDATAHWDGFDSCARRADGAPWETSTPAPDSARGDCIAEDGLELAVRQAAQLIVKAISAQGFVNGAVLARAAGDDRPVDGASFIANGHARVLAPSDSLTPLCGVCLHQGEQVLVIGPWLVSFDQLSAHGFLSEQEVSQLRLAARIVGRDFHRTLSRKNTAIRDEWEATHSSHFSPGSTGDSTGETATGH